MATQAQIKANRQNALKSTGPRTKEGKEAVSQNATKHGLCASKNVIKSESQEEYNIFHDKMIADLSPVGAMEEMLAERIVNLSCRLKRAEVFQNAVIESMTDDVFDLSWDSYIRAQNQAKEGDMSLLLGIAIRRDFENSKILEHLLVYERRIESSLYKAAAELRKLQKLRQKETAANSCREQVMIDEGRRPIEDGRETKDEEQKTRVDGRGTKDQERSTIEDRRVEKQSQFGADIRLQTQDIRKEVNENMKLNPIP
jgi:hypothetical protein